MVNFGAGFLKLYNKIRFTISKPSTLCSIDCPNGFKLHCYAQEVRYCGQKTENLVKEISLLSSSKCEAHNQLLETTSSISDSSKHIKLGINTYLQYLIAVTENFELKILKFQQSRT